MTGKKTLLAGVGVVILWIAAAAVLPVTTDEAYYYLWSTVPDFGYFDHPPLVVLMAWTSRLAGGSPLVARLGTIAVGCATLFVAIRLFKKAGLKDDRSLALAVLLSHVNLLGLIYGFLTTPDTVLLFSWALTLHELLAALRENPKRWVTAGLAAGLGLLSKYTMVLIGVVAMIAGRKRLKSPWPWAGVLAAILVFSPHILWNAENDWITMKFQLRHGFQMDRPVMPGKILPVPLPPRAGSPEDRLAQAFRKLRETAAKEEKKPRVYDPALQSLNRYLGFYASQIVLWGAMGPLILLWLWRGRKTYAELSRSALTPEARTLLMSATGVPLAVFGLISLVSKVEANWSGMYVLGAAALLVPLAAAHARAFTIAAGVNVAVFLGLLAQTQFGLIPVRPHKDRLLRETHGYNSLAKKLETLDGPVFGDSFQVVSMVRFHVPTLTVRQWPGITRDSELVRRKELNDLTFEDLRARGAFWLVTTDELPPRLPGFRAEGLTLLRDCKAGGLQEIPSSAAGDAANRCKDPIHEWYLVRYHVTEEQGPHEDG